MITLLQKDDVRSSGNHCRLCFCLKPLFISFANISLEDIYEYM